MLLSRNLLGVGPEGGVGTLEIDRYTNTALEPYAALERVAKFRNCLWDDFRNRQPIQQINDLLGVTLPPPEDPSWTYEVDNWEAPTKVVRDGLDSWEAVFRV